MDAFAGELLEKPLPPRAELMPGRRHVQIVFGEEGGARKFATFMMCLADRVRTERGRSARTRRKRAKIIGRRCGSGSIACPARWRRVNLDRAATISGLFTMNWRHCPKAKY